MTRPETVADLLLARAGDDRPGLRAGDREWTWDQVVRESAARAALARELREDGPFHVAVLLGNVPEYLFWLGGAALAGATVVGVNPTRSGASLAREVRHTDPQLVVTDTAGAERLAGLDLGVAPGRYLNIDDGAYAALSADRPGDPVRDPAVTAATQFLLLFTSGSTGAPKAARCSQGRLTRLGHANSAKFGVTRDDVAYCPMPLFHGNALMALWAPALAAGSAIALTPRFSASGFLSDVRRFGATYFTYVGKAIAYILATPERPDDADNPLTHAFGTEAAPEDRAEFHRRFGCRLVEGYGSSESSGLIRRTPDAPPTALGRPAHDGVRVVDPETRRTRARAVLDGHGRVTNAEEAVGEIVDVDGAAAFEGYYRNPEADAERVRHGWYWTGDLGYVDEAGFLYFAGRAGDLIRVDSENVSARPIEAALRRHPLILDAMVFGVPDPRSGDAVMAAVEVPAGAGFADLALPAFLAGRPDLGAKELPRYVRVSHALPVTGSGKLGRQRIRLDGWRTGDPVYRWTGRGAPDYTLLTAEGKAALRAEFAANGRERFLPGGDRPANAGEWRGYDLGARTVRYEDRDAILYALAVGATAADLDLVFEDRLRVLPSFALTRAQWAPDALGAAGAFDPATAVHGSQRLRVHRPLPRSGELALTARVGEVWDKGGAAVFEVVVECEYFTATWALFAPGRGGFGGRRGPSAPPRPDGPPDEKFEVATFPDQAALYRLLGDRHAMHIDPDAARAAGMPRPFLHGLCTLATVALPLAGRLGAHPADLAALDGRFAAPVFPGDRLRVRVWHDATAVRFEAVSGGTPVITGGRAQFRVTS